MDKMIRAILFDFDGTLADTAPGIVKTMQETFRRMQLPIPDERDMRATIGLPLTQALQMLGQLNDEDALIATRLYKELFPTFEASDVSIFDGVRDTLARLRDHGLRLAIVTSRESVSLDMICEHHGIRDCFETRVTHSDHLPSKPAPDMVLALLDRMQLDRNEVLVVGDTTYDIEMGNRAGCRTVAVTYGNHTRQQLLSAHPTYMIDTFRQLTQFI